MKIHLLKKRTIERYCGNNAQSRISFDSWLRAIRLVDWDKPEDILNEFTSADLLRNGSERVVFDIGGNRYRMICKYVFGESEVHLYICWIGTHTQYTRLCNDNRQYTITNF